MRARTATVGDRCWLVSSGSRKIQSCGRQWRATPAHLIPSPLQTACVCAEENTHATSSSRNSNDGPRVLFWPPAPSECANSSSPKKSTLPLARCVFFPFSFVASRVCWPSIADHTLVTRSAVRAHSSARVFVPADRLASRVLGHSICVWRIFGGSPWSGKIRSAFHVSLYDLLCHTAHK
jgi:hypothetical protein